MGKLKNVFLVMGGIVIGAEIAYLGATNLLNSAYNEVTMAYWFQAVGSIAAIFGAFAVGRMQEIAARKQADRDHARALQSKRLASRSIADAAYSAILDLRNVIKNDRIDWDSFPLFYREDVFAELITSISKIPIFELEKAEAAECVIGMQSAMLSIRQLLAAAQHSRLIPGPAAARAVKREEELSRYVESAIHSYGLVRKQFQRDSDRSDLSFPPPPRSVADDRDMADVSADAQMYRAHTSPPSTKTTIRFVGINVRKRRARIRPRTSGVR
ncbi:hypothetical protein [Burkholderia stagnalis]